MFDGCEGTSEFINSGLTYKKFAHTKMRQKIESEFHIKAVSTENFVYTNFFFFLFCLFV